MKVRNVFAEFMGWLVGRDEGEPVAEARMDATPVRTLMRFTLGNTPEEDVDIARAFMAPGDRLEDNPQFRATLFTVENLFRLSLEDESVAPLEELKGYRRALLDVHDDLRKRWEAAHPTG